MRNSPGEGGWGYSGFQVTAVIERVFGFEIFNWGIFLGRKIWQVFLEWVVLNRDFLGYSKQSEDLWQCPRICSSANKVQPKLLVLYY